MDYFLLYLILRLDTISNIVITTAIVTGVFFMITLLVFILNFDVEKIRNASKPWIKGFGIPFTIALFFACIVPDTKQTAVIYCLPKVINNKQVQGIPDKLLKLSDMWLDEKIQEATKPITETVEN